MNDSDKSKLEAIYLKFAGSDGNVISLLQDMQESFGYLPEDALYWISDKTNIPVSRFFGVATFYKQFYLKPRGKNIITACCGTACHVKGSHRIIQLLTTELKLTPGEYTTSDGMFTLDSVACVGACSIAPVVIINHKVHGKMTPDKMTKELRSGNWQVKSDEQ